MAPKRLGPGGRLRNSGLRPKSSLWGSTCICCWKIADWDTQKNKNKNTHIHQTPIQARHNYTPILAAWFLKKWIIKTPWNNYSFWSHTINVSYYIFNHLAKAPVKSDNCCGKCWWRFSGTAFYTVLSLDLGKGSMRGVCDCVPQMSPHLYFLLVVVYLPGDMDMHGTPLPRFLHMQDNILSRY